MKNILLEIINNDTSYNKSATKMLKRTHPLLWQELLDKTNFLPNDALPKQRVWHVLNDIWERPTCPQTGEYVKWKEKCYCSFISASAKATYQNKLGLYKNRGEDTNRKRSESVTKNYELNPDVIDKKKDTWIKKYGVENPFKAKSIQEKARQTCLEKYGVDNPSKCPKILNKIYETQVQNGSITPREKRSDKRRYYDAVALYTAESWKTHFDKINPLWLDRSSGWELDHIYSKHRGFQNNIPPYIIGHWTNLQMLSKSVNSSKRDKCHKTQEKLFEDFFNNVV